MIYLSNIPKRCYKLSRKEKKQYIKQYGKRSYRFYCLQLQLQDLSKKNKNGFKDFVANIDKFRNILEATALAAIGTNMVLERLKNFNKNFVQALEINMPNFDVSQDNVNNGTLFTMSITDNFSKKMQIYER